MDQPRYAIERRRLEHAYRRRRLALGRRFLSDSRHLSIVTTSLYCSRAHGAICCLYHPSPPKPGGLGTPGRPMREAVFRVATYNTHKCRGMDGRIRPHRVAQVLQELEADVIALQEVASL